MATRRRQLAAAGLVAGAAAAAWAWSAGGEKPRRASVIRQDLVLTVEVEGVLRAVDAVTIGPPAVPEVWNYKISFLVPEGTEVAAGQRVAGFDTTELQQTLQDKIGERDSAAKALEKRTSELDIERQDLELPLAEARSRQRKGALALEVPEDLVARQELESTRVEHALAQSEIAAMERRLAQLAQRRRAELTALQGKRDRAAGRVVELQRHLQAMEVEAPRAGTVVYATREQGEKPKVGDSVWRAQNVLEIPDLRRMVAEGKVDEAEMGRLAVGQPVQLRLDALPDETFRGVVQAVSKAVESRSTSDPARVVEVRIVLDRSDPARMRPGMRFRGDVEVERVPEVLCLPLAAVAPRPGPPVVTVVRGFSTVEVTPRLGRRDDECIEVLAGLEAGDRVQVAAGGET
jgi:multidrug resistance efflux pump